MLWAPDSVSTRVVPLCVALSPHCVSTLNPTLLQTRRLRRDGILEPQGEARLKQVVRHINLEEMGWLPVSHVSLDFLTLRAQRSDWELIIKGHTVPLYFICTNFKCTEYSSCWLIYPILLCLINLWCIQHSRFNNCHRCRKIEGVIPKEFNVVG